MRDGTPRTLLLHAAPLAALFALACALLAPAAPATAARRAGQEAGREKKQSPPADSTVYGRVVYDDSGRPGRRARVMLVDESGSRPEYNALTDGDGAFRIERVRAGSYFAFVDIPGVLSPVGFVRVSQVRGRSVTDFSEARKFFDTVDVDGKQDSRFNVRARRGAALSGRVTYADGDPAVGVTVNLMRRGPDGRLEKFLAGINITTLAGLKTDDRGVFRQSGLPPGEYVLAVSEQADHGDKGGEGGMRDPATSVLEALAGQQFLMTFYPSATRAKDAVVVKAEAGVERPDLDITIPDRVLHAVGGVARGKADKRPVANAKVTIVSREEGAGADSTLGGERFASNNSTTTDAAGRWEFREIPEGSYTVTVKPPEEQEEEPSASAGDAANGNMNGGYARARRKKKRGYAPARRDLEVIDSDLSDVAVELNDGARVSGSIAYEGGNKEGYGYFSLRRVPDGAGVKGAEELGDGWNSYASEGGFEIAGLPAGKYFIQFSGYAEDGRVYVKSISWNGRDLLREPLELAEGAAVEGVRVTISTNPSKLRVRVTGGRRKGAPRSFAVTLIPSDIAAWSPHAQQLSCFTDEEGACEIAAPPGEYRVVAVPALANAGSYEEELRRRAVTAPHATLAPGETKSFEVSPPDS
jgi:hypothetical protein